MRPVERPSPPPLTVDVRRHVLIGTVVWAVAFLVLLAFHDRLAANGDLWWLGTCAAGFGLGLLGLFYLRRPR